jgi:hypothetical protein
MSSGTFVAFSKFHLNTSNSPNTKVVYFVEEHNFHVEWHLRFGVEVREKAWSMLVVTIHRRPENNNLGMQFVQKRWRKGPYALCKSCRGSRDRQLWYSNVCPLQFNFLEKNSVKCASLSCFLLLALQSTRPRRRRVASAPCRRWARMPRPANARWSMRSGTLPRRTAIPAISPCPTRRARIGRSRRPRRPPSGVATVLRSVHCHVVPHAANVSCLT